jgi:hypothetical protein
MIRMPLFYLYRRIWSVSDNLLYRVNIIIYFFASLTYIRTGIEPYSRKLKRQKRV